ncbi:hypothetical protein LVJ82_06420 [Vitreoscilla massiliensis]|uniref:Uncharacterized protein n=1 Tax=Vitreoscilla massiliensis TaxID=1689272 RepID=A0ABY4E5E8_9NEIS|nr:hypothetical protein [Vitreoscilla massiliensis]UOO90606.1 hypothetical protein LVJ82_06420 [Vitreoscilla massiliensis]
MPYKRPVNQGVAGSDSVRLMKPSVGINGIHSARLPVRCFESVYLFTGRL